MDETLTEVLRWINEVRSIRGMDSIVAMPRGVPCDPHGCPVAKALDANVTAGGMAYAHGPGWSPVHLPAAAQTFASDFDVGLYPALEEAESSPRPSRRGSSGLVSA